LAVGGKAQAVSTRVVKPLIEFVRRSGSDCTMRIFINNVDSYVGKALCADLRGALEQENRLLGTVTGGSAEAEVMELAQSMGVKRIVARENSEQYLKDVLSCSLVVYDLHSANLEEVETVIKHLKVAQLDHDTTFVIISSVNVWAKTKKEYVPVEGEDGEGEEAGEEGEDGIENEVKKMPKELSDADMDRRIPPPAFESWKYLETLALSLSSKDKLRPHVVSAGILYGNGETTFNELFKEAWLTRATHTIIYPGDNYIPCVHVRDVARLVKTIHVRDPSTTQVAPYLIAVDKARLTQAEIVRGIVSQISKKNVDVPVVSPEEATSEFRDVMTLDLIMEPSAPMKSKSFPWWSRDGLVANLEKVAAEFCKWRNLRPIKMVVLGPPGAGAERLCSMVAERYLHADPPHLTFDQILQDAMNAGTASAERLREKVQLLSQKPGAKLPLKLRTKLVMKRLMSNVCRYRGYVLEGYPENYEEANALFMEKVPEEGEEAAAEEEGEGEEGEEEEEEEEEAPPPPEDDEEEEGDGVPKRRLNAAVAPQFAVVLHSSPAACKERIFAGTAKGPLSEAEFDLRTAEYHRANLALDGSPGTSDFFSEVAQERVLQINIDEVGEEEAFQSMRVYMEANGQFFNYLKSEEERCREREAELAQQEREADERRNRLHQERESAENALRAKVAEGEAARRQIIAEGEASLLEAEVQPLRQYLMTNVVPTLSDGLSEVCKEQPEDPIEFLAQYLFAHAQDIQGTLDERYG